MRLIQTVIKDCIYRFIEIPKLCKQFADTHEFQRLRNIKQLGLVHYVYPSAVHSRFEHSLGVMHLAGQVVDNLIATGTTVSQREKELVQLAGLLHDVGHVAFSHLMDYILEENGIDDHHEDRSVWILRRINGRLGLLARQEEDMVACMIQGDYAGQDKPFLFEIVSNSTCGLDVDRFDYLQRDAYHTGIPGFQPDYLIRCTRVKENRLVFLKKSHAEIRLLYETRKRMFTMVYRHKTVIKIERLFRSIFRDMNLLEEWQQNRSDGESRDRARDGDRWLNLDDVEMMYRLKKHPKFQQVLTRSWNRGLVSAEDTLRHCHYLSEEDISRQISRVEFI